MNIIGWQTLFDTTLTAAATSVTISGLNGNTDKEYKLVTRIISEYNGSCNIFIRPNNEIGGYYGYQFVYGGTASTGAARGTQSGLYIGNPPALNRIDISSTTIQAESGFIRTAITENLQDVVATSCGYIVLTGSSWNNTANITSLVVLASQTNGLGSGSQITLYGKATISSLRYGEVIFIGDC